jgi:hypothetical protein
MHASFFAAHAMNALLNDIRGKYVVCSSGRYDYMDLEKAREKKIFDRFDILSGLRR